MFDFDSLKEILITIRQNKLRTFLTGFAIAWGIFILIVLLGAGNGLRNGVTSNMTRRAKNTIGLTPGYTSMAYAGLPVEREIKFDDRDIELIRDKTEGVSHFSPMLNKSATMSYGTDYGSWSLRGVYPDAEYINNMTILEGRFINDIDIKEKRKVMVISPEMENILFKDKNPIGKYLTVDSLAYMVVGVYKDEGSFGSSPAYAPFTTVQAVSSKFFGLDRIEFVVPDIDTEAKSLAFEESLRKQLGAIHRFDPKDRSALYIRNTAQDAAQANMIFGGVDFVIWMIGFLILVAGVIGVGNIMLITVKERTREFGIRKAIGASPGSILKLVVLESIIITAVFGYIGMICGIGITEVINYYIESIPRDPDAPVMFKDPTVGLGIVIQATLTLILAGVLAGLIPALKAVRVKPIEAMRAE
ncbi:putative ABC transport system permease protein [Dysgonomonas sp. PH5-45]|uniref:ABC transporter permease n=1 Tax=unclassified Dysgonomonas TaxID=2630389 RepID=UPI002475DD79|nr:MULTISPECIES: ABC transporter permease [unclassified Dysgonomonas]MDH6355595.1 putative ABC transport system permease protein [Dysgonomonas sp. PH5-45]MDH6388495.1 putative ABC transport system permease protein [Dysgonomonas sp. PH5-37]